MRNLRAGISIAATVAMAQSAMAQTAADSLVRIEPTVIEVDAATHHAVFRVQNPSDSVVVATPVVTFHRLTADERHLASGSGKYRDSVASDSTGTQFGLRDWVEQPSPHVTLQPRGSATITYDVTIPSGLAPGEYVAYVYCRTSRITADGAVSYLNDIGGDFTGPATLIYHATVRKPTKG